MALACGVVLIPAWSQQESTPQQVEITGSRIKRIDAEGASPVQVLRREDIARTGATTVREVLDSLSGATASLSDIGGSNSFSPGASSASLRNLGKQSTLVLLNSRRISPYPLADYSEVFSNIDSLPLGAIDRIEILKNGGSAIYGSDAVAGVINIITRSDYQGVQLDLSAQQSLKNSFFKSHSAAITAGLGDWDADGYNLLANLELYRRDGFFWSDVLGEVNPRYASKSPSFGTPSTYAYPGNVIGVGPVEGCATVVGGLCRYDRYERFEVIPPTARANLLVSGRKRLDADTTVFAELLYSKVRASYAAAFGTYGVAQGPTVWGDPATGSSKVFYPRGLPVGHPLNPTDEEVEFRYRFVDGPAEEHTDTQQYRALAGLQGRWSSFDWETAIGVMGGKTDDRQRGGLSDSGFKQVVGDYNLDPLPADFFNKPGGYRIGQPNSPEVLRTLFPTYGYQGSTTQTFLDGKISGDLAKWSAGTVGLAMGFDLRHEKMRISPTANLASGDIVGFGTSASNASRTFGAIFAELSLPVMKTLELQLAGRIDRFPGFAAHFSPKLGLRFQPVPEFLARATFEGGFRAPNLTESATSTKFAFEPGVDDPKRCPQAVALAQDLQAQAAALPDTDPNQSLLFARADSVVQNECGASAAIISRNNPALKPETSRSYSLGFVVQPLRDWSTGVDYWHIERRNEIGQKTTQDLLTTEDSQPAGVLNRGSLADDPTFSAAEQAQYGVSAGALQSVNVLFENLFKTRTSGIDLSVKGGVASPIGRLGLDLDATYLLEYKAWSTSRNGYGDNLAGRYGYSRWVVVSSFSLKTGDFDQTLRYRWQSATRLQADFDDTTWTTAGCADVGLSARECQVGAYNRWDYSVAYTGIKNLRLGVYVRNLFNQRPPPDYRAFGVPSGIIPPDPYDVQGRQLKLSAEYKFL
ncbi:MAG TPA: TonB-dependent receptor [Ideonella sp.]|nr:TonB-dependent receptor [Ideonella sp.]